MFSRLFCTSCILVFNSCGLVFESHNLVLFLVWKLDLDLSFILCSHGSSCPWKKLIISYTCELHQKLYILSPLNISFLSNGFLNESFPCNPFLQNFKTLKFLYDLVFHWVHQMNMYFHRRGHVFVVYIFWN